MSSKSARPTAATGLFRLFRPAGVSSAAAATASQALTKVSGSSSEAMPHARKPAIA